MIAAAETEGNKEAKQSFFWANEVEKIHARLYQKMLDGMETAGRGEYPYYVCPVCGFTAEKETPEICPVCGAKGKAFKKIG